MGVEILETHPLAVNCGDLHGVTAKQLGASMFDNTHTRKRLLTLLGVSDLKILYPLAEPCRREIQLKRRRFTLLPFYCFYYGLLVP